MKTWKRALALVLALVMALSLVALPSFAEGETGNAAKYNVIIRYVFENGNSAASDWTATIDRGTDLERTIKSPDVTGYTPDPSEVKVSVQNIQKDVLYKVTYKPAQVNFTVEHYQQNLNDDKYTKCDTVTKTGFTESPVGENLAETYEGFTVQPYDTTTKIAADGSTVVQIYYDRNYYLLNLDLAGGWGADPIYARYGAVIGLSSPTKSGYTFGGWNPTAPTNMPAKNQTLTAQWNPVNSVDYTVVFWYQNANDDGYSYAGNLTQSGKPGASVSSGQFSGTDFTGRDASHFTYNAAKAETVTVNGDGSTVVNVYFTRNTYTLKFRVLDCDKWFMHSHSDSCYKVVKTITAKWNAKISDEFSKAPFTTTYNGRAWECTDSSKYDYALQTLDRMPGFDATFNLYDKSSNTKKTIYYYVQKVGTTVNANSWPSNANNFDLLKQVDTYFNFATYDEEYHEIQGFTRYSAKVAGFSSSRKDFSSNRLNLYYLRNSYTLKFYNYDTELTDHQAPLQYEAPLKDKNFTPAYPSNLEANAYEFAGWYTTPGCYDGSEVKWDTDTMPAGDLMLYAKWAPKTHTVRTYLTEDAMNAGTGLIDTWENVPHRSTINKPANPTNGKYTFVGWFYKENGVEKAYDFSMAVTKDMDLYAKWNSNVMVPYTIRFQLANGTIIGDPVTGYALAGTTKTFDAKTGTDLYEGYRDGYFPMTSSHNLKMDIEGTNEYVFVYVQRDKVPYTVKYLNRDTGESVAPEKSGETANSIITENAVYVQGYVPDASSKRLVLSANDEENVLIFYYTKDTVNTLVTVRYWQQNAQGDGYTLVEETTETAAMGSAYTADKKSYDGFNYARATAEVGGNVQKTFQANETVSYTVPSDNLLVLNLYYDRIEYNYEFRFVEDLTGTTVADPVTGAARYGSTVVQGYKNLESDGYALKEGQSENAQITVTMEDGKNVYTFHYMPFFNVVEVKNGNNGTAQRITMTNQHMDMALGGFSLTDMVPEGYLYGGAFEADHTTPIDFANGQSGLRFVPTRGQTYYIWEVPDTYLRPSNYRVARHIDGVQTLCKLYPLTTADRLLYKEVGFSAYFGNDTASVVDIKSGSNNAEFETPVANPGAATVYQMVKAARNGKVETTVYVMDGKLSSVNADITDGTANGKPIDPGYIGGARLTDDQFAKFKTDGITYTPYWITLDGVKVTGTMQRNLTFDASEPNVAQIKRIPVATTCTYVEDTPAVRLLNFATAFNMDDSQTTVDTRITVTVQDGASTYTTKVQPGDPVELTPNGQDGKLFAGWYVDGKVSDLSGFTADTTVVAKYVDGSYLDLDYSRIGLLRVRGVTLISAVDDEDNYQDVGIMVNGEPVSSVRFASRYMLFNTPSSMFGVARGSRFVIADQSLYGSGALEVTPYWITMDGTTVLGQSHTLHYTSRSIWE